MENFLIKYDYPINWNVSGFGIQLIMEYIKKCIFTLENYKYTNPIKTIHGSYSSKFNGGRVNGNSENLDFIKSQIKWFNDHNVGIKLTFSSSTISKKDFDDKEMRFYLDLLSENPNVRNGIICQVDEFAEFIKKEYPQLEIVASYVKCGKETILGKTDTVEYYNKLFDLYDIVVINTFRVYDDEFLSEIKYKDRIEIIANNSCRVNCQQTKYHHELCEKIQKCLVNINNKERHYQNIYQFNELKKEETDLYFKCLKTKNELLKNNNLNYINQLDKNQINKLLNIGINNFKLEGRHYLFDSYKLKTLYKYIIDINSNFENILDIINYD